VELIKFLQIFKFTTHTHSPTITGVISKKILFLLLTILSTLIFVWPELNFQDQLAQGDHGRDLYAFEVVYKGQLPYKDFWWVYGPIMPYYYGLFYKVFGVHITSVLLGRALLLIGCAALFYLSCAVIMTPGLAFLGAVWFIEGRQEFTCTYNHIGGTLASLVIMYALLSYVRLGSARYLWLSLLSTFFLMLVKVNFGVVSLFIILVGIPAIDALKHYSWENQKKKFYLTALVPLPLITAAIYWFLLKDLPSYAVHQCMPYFGNDEPYHAPLFVSIYAYFHGFWVSFFSTPQNVWIGLVLHLSTLAAVGVLLSGRLPKDEAKNIWLSLGLTGLFFVLYFHEYLLSNVWYRSFWSYPFVILFHFVMIAIAFKVLHPVLRVLVLIFLWKLMLLGGLAHINQIQHQKTPDHYLSMPRGQIYVGNEPPWVDTVNKATDYLNTNLSKDDLFFALPYDCLYYYLTGKTSPTRQLIFFDHIHIPPEQETAVIKELEDKHVDYVLMSTRIVSMEMGLGFFGKTYCPLLAKYLGDNFTQIYQQGGDPQRSAGWADNHGVFVLKRN